MDIKKIVLFLFIFSSLFLTGCYDGNSIVYKKAIFKINTEKKLVSIPYFDSVSLADNGKVYLIFKGIWEYDPNTEREEKITREGMGPNEVYAPNKILCEKESCWINSYYPFNFIYRLNLFSTKIERVKLKEAISFDDFKVSQKELYMVNPYWKNSLVKILNLNTGEKIKECGKGKFIGLMMKFNVNQAHIAIGKNRIYVAQSIIPKIEVFSFGCEELYKIKLSPPFYMRIPKKYNVKKYDEKGHREWMSRWTALDKIYLFNNWLFVMYKKGYEDRYYYEIFELNEKKSKRYYTRGTGIFIVNLENDFNFEGVKSTGEKLLWVKGRLFF